MDLQNVFYHDKLERPSYAEQPKRFQEENIRRSKVMLLQSSLYGLKEAGRKRFILLLKQSNAHEVKQVKSTREVSKYPVRLSFAK